MADDPNARNLSPLANLPKKEGGAGSALPKLDNSKQSAAPPPTKTPPLPPPKGKGVKITAGPALWTTGSVFSLALNVILVIILLFVSINLYRARLINITRIGPELLGGLYVNFEKMDRAHITSNIPVETTIPVKFDLQLNQQTNVVLSQDVKINGVRITVNTGGLNITNAVADIVLPKGATLPIFLNLTVPVDTTVPVVLDVAVDIPLAKTQLHEPFAGLRDVVGPLYCLFKSDAQDMDGKGICK